LHQGYSHLVHLAVFYPLPVHLFLYLLRVVFLWDLRIVRILGVVQTAHALLDVCIVETLAYIAAVVLLRCKSCASLAGALVHSESSKRLLLAVLLAAYPVVLLSFVELLSVFVLSSVLTEVLHH
jgi:hypothetical protein